MSSIYQVMAAYNRQLAADEASASMEMARRWMQVESRLQGAFDALLEQVSTQGAKTPSEIFRLYRYDQLIQTAQGEIGQFEAAAGRIIGAQSERAISLGLEAAVRSLYGENFFTPGVNRGALANMIGVCADGKPLFDLLAKRALAGVSVEGLSQALVEGIALGYGPRKVARMMAAGLSAGLNKALVIAQTEQVRAYREASRQQYAAMGVQEYQRHCAKSDRTCVACLALDGKKYKIGRIMDSHPRCRCFMVALPPPGWQPTGEQEERARVPGERARVPEERARAQEWFSGLDEKRQRAILGDRRWELYRDGKPLSDMVRIKEHPIWGPTIGIKRLA